MRMREKQIDYTLRESHRAKRVILRVGVNGLEVVVPRRFGKRRLPGIIEANRVWIEKELQRVKDSPTIAGPECINLNAIDEIWQVDYRSLPTTDDRYSVQEKASTQLLVEGDANDVRRVSSVLVQWLHLKTHTHLVPWLKGFSQEIDIPFQKATVRGQTTRWASCSRLGNISLNRSLLFLPKHLVRHVFLHELCHIKEMNHSPDFWRLLHQMEPDFRVLETEVKKAGQYVPQWVHSAPS